MDIFSTFGGLARSSRSREDFAMSSTRLRYVFVSRSEFSHGCRLTPASTQTAAKLALELHGRELEPGHSLNVYISNPKRKKERTDADANSREVYVAGLSKFVTKEDLEKLFRTVSSMIMSSLPR